MPKEKPVILQCHCREIVCFGKSQGPCIECKAKDNISHDFLGICDAHVTFVNVHALMHTRHTMHLLQDESSAHVGGRGISAARSQAFIEFVDQLDFDGESVDSNPPDLHDLDIDLEEINL
eukprot:scaffold142170_cov67-Attheya_sp.AAC.1